MADSYIHAAPEYICIGLKGDDFQYLLLYA